MEIKSRKKQRIFFSISKKNWVGWVYMLSDLYLFRVYSYRFKIGRRRWTSIEIGFNWSLFWLYNKLMDRIGICLLFSQCLIIFYGFVVCFYEQISTFDFPSSCSQTTTTKPLLIYTPADTHIHTQNTPTKR